MRKLSICIPTFNRASDLDRTMASIVCQGRFVETSDVEIVVSDNCSEDSTRDVVERYVAQYPGKVLYRKTEKNIFDLNFHAVLSMGRGAFLKLNNDTLSHTANSLDSMISILDAQAGLRPVLFFSNGHLGSRDVITTLDFEAFVSRVSYWSTWIGGFGVWKSDFDAMGDFNRMSSRQLVQMDVLLRMVEQRGRAVIDDRVLCKSLMVSAKGGYDFLSVFMDNYLLILREYRERQKLSEAAFQIAKRRLLLEFILPWHVKSMLGFGSYFSFHDRAEKFERHFGNDRLLWLQYYFRFLLFVLKYSVKQVLGLIVKFGSAGRTY